MYCSVLRSDVVKPNLIDFFSFFGIQNKLSQLQFKT